MLSTAILNGADVGVLALDLPPTRRVLLQPPRKIIKSGHALRRGWVSSGEGGPGPWCAVRLLAPLRLTDVFWGRFYQWTKLFFFSSFFLQVNWHNPDRNDCTALMAAVDEGWIAGTRLLLEAGADVNGQAMNGQTALHFAAINHFTMLAELLLAYNADHSLTTSAGETAADLASAARHEKIVLMIDGAAKEFNNMSLEQLEGAFAETQVRTRPPLRQDRGVGWGVGGGHARVHDISGPV